MSRAEIIILPNALARRIGPRARVFTAALVQRAEQALAKVSALFGGWLQEDIAAAEAAVAGLDHAHGSPAVEGAAGEEGGRTAALRAVRQLRSSGAAFGFPVISRIAGSLCLLLEAEAGDPPPKLTAAHLDAIKAAARDGRRDTDDPVANATCAELEAQTRLLLARRPA